MKISHDTKQHILHELKSRSVSWFGKIDEQDFVSKLVDLTALPSDDPRFENMQGDFRQHRINNPDDWEDDWIYLDPRIDLTNSDEIFIKFITELLHPSVRDGKEAQKLKEMINYYLKRDGCQIVEDEAYYEADTYTYKFAEINPTQIEKSFKTVDEFVHESYEKIDKRLREEDYSGAVTSARTLLEYSIKDIYNQITGDTIDKIDDLQAGFKKIQKLLKLDYDKSLDENKKAILRSFVTIVSSLASLYNGFADRHATKSTARRNNALFCTDSTKIFVNFIYGRMKDIHGLYPSIYERLVKELDSDLRSKNRSTLIATKNIATIIEVCDEYIIGHLINKHISESGIHSFRASDIFFAFLRIFLPSLTEKQLYTALEKHKRNDQAIGWEDFLNELYKTKKELFSKRVLVVISEYPELASLSFK